MKFIENIDKKKYEEFLKQNAKSHFLQSHSWGDFCIDNKRMFPHYVGVLDDENKLIATALLLEKKLPLKFSYFYSPRGYVLDYSNKELLIFLTDEIKKYAKKKNAIFIKIDPDIKLHNLSLDGNIINDGFSNEELIIFLKSIGYKHLGFNKAFEHNQPRYTFRLDLTQEISKIKNNFHSTTKKIINKGNLYNLEIYKNDEKYIDDFYLTMKETAKRESISLYSKEYYKNFYKLLHKNGNSDIYIIYLNKNKTTNTIKNIKNELSENLKKIKIETKKNEILNQISKLDKLLEELNMVDFDKLPLSSIITAKYGDKVWTIHGGNHSILRNLNSNYLIYYEIIKDATNEKYKTIDFFGTAYNPKPDDPEYGIFLFKKRLGGEYTEFIGELDYIIKPFLYFTFTKLVFIKRRIYKYINKKRGQK